MKNIKIGAKIFIAFGAVIVFMLMSTVVVFVSNISIIDNVGKISSDSSLQTAGNTLKDNFLLARVAAVRVLSTTDESVYQAFVQQASAVTDNYAEIYKLIDQNSFLEEYRPAFEKAEADFKTYLAKAAELGQANRDEEAQIIEMLAAGATLTESGDLIFRDQVQLLRDEIYDASMTSDARQRRADRLQTGSDIALKVSEFRIYAREMMANFDTSGLPTALEIIDEAYAITEDYNKASTIPLNIQHSQLIMDAISAYRTALIEFSAVCDSAALISNDMGPMGATALASLSTAVEELDTAVEKQVAATTSSASSSLIWVVGISLLSVLVAVALAIIIMKGITVPVSKMVRAADALALGDVDVDARYESKDEIGMLSASFVKMLEGIRSQVEIVEALADGDLTVSVDPRSDRDTMGFGLQKMLENLNSMFSEINSASDQVSTGSRQIADGAQSLAQGSTEQASAVEQLSASIAQVADKTKSNAGMASQAANLAESIKQSAEKGSEQMTNMMQAVKEINDASQSISKVIKVIDEIAFQTNILALNAAVEAARAGQHGKGFAVVAEEVRSLAGKSAEAAKNTGELIANSMEKAEYGSRIAQETASSLAEIVSGINESTRLVAEIARTSGEQSDSVTQINTGIDQVAQVVQRNSATAQQSAAASEEMTEQSNMLRERIAQFKLKQSPYQSYATPLLMRKIV